MKNRNLNSALDPKKEKNRNSSVTKVHLAQLKLCCPGPAHPIPKTQVCQHLSSSFPPNSPRKRTLTQFTCPFNLPFQDLFKNPQFTCFSTLVPHKSIAITKIGKSPNSSVEINGVLVSHPDLFLGGPVSIHSVVGPFSSLPVNEPDPDRDWEITQPSFCNSSSSVKTSNAGEWDRIVSFMSTNGFVSFAIRLRSVLDGILVDYPELDAVTIFAPLDFLFVTPSWPLLDRMVRFHMVPLRLSFAELALLPEKSILKTLVPGRDLVITGSAYSERRRVVAVSGVEIVAPDSFSSEHFVVHGLSGAFTMGELPIM